VNRRYTNPHITRFQAHPLHVFLWKLGWFDDPRELSGAPFGFEYPLADDLFDPARPSAVWINHSSFLITYQGVSILTDPIWSPRCSPFQFIGPERWHEPAMRFEELPRIDFVVISHDHYDHLDHRTVMRLFRTFPHIHWIVPQGVKSWFLKRGIDKVVELSWWEEHRLHAPFPIKVTSVPAQHFSGRGLFDLNKTLWMGAVLEIDKAKTIYFVGDTGYNPVDFKEIGSKWGGFDLSLIPIGAYIPRKFMSPVHIDPAEAVLIHKEVGSRLSVGMHWKTFNLGDESLHQPPYDLFLALQREGIDPKTFKIVDPGHGFNY